MPFILCIYKSCAGKGIRRLPQRGGGKGSPHPPHPRGWLTALQGLCKLWHGSVPQFPHLEKRGNGGQVSRPACDSTAGRFRTAGWKGNGTLLGFSDVHNTCQGLQDSAVWSLESS